MTHSNTEIFFNTLAGANPLDVFMGLSIVVQLLVVLILLLGVGVLILTLLRLLSSAKGRNAFLAVASIAAPALTLLAVAYEGFRSYLGYTMSHSTHIYVLFPTIIESMEIVILGGIVTLVAIVGNRPKRA